LEDASLTEETRDAIAGADLIVFAPSNPLVSIAPIINLPGMRDALTTSGAPIIGVSPIIAGQVVKGPADRMMKSLGHRADAAGVAQLYQGLLQHFLIDAQDADLATEIAELGIATHVADILMPDLTGKARLAREVLELGQRTRGQAA
jgi:LPPG:FO 2-phospho-L-lactate transferase